MEEPNGGDWSIIPSDGPRRRDVLYRILKGFVWEKWEEIYWEFGPGFSPGSDPDSQVTFINRTLME